MQQQKPMTEEDYGQAMLALARSENHKPKMPRNDYADKPKSSDLLRDALLTYFTSNRKPVFRSELSEILDVEADTLRRACRALVFSGYLISRRTQTGVVYTPTHRVPRALPAH